MTVGAGADPGPAPDRTVQEPPVQGTPAQEPPVQESPVQKAARKAGQGSSTWHRFHYAVGVFLVAYGGTGLLSAVLMWGDRQDEVQGYFGALPATAVLILVKVIEVALTASAAAALVLRRDVLLVPPMVGWMAGFAMFAVLDVFTAGWGGLVEHLLYLAAFVVLLFLSYGLSAKAQLAGAAKDEDDGSSGGGRQLTRTQEFALQAINRAAALTGPRPRPGRPA